MTEKPEPPREMYGIRYACDLISQHYGRAFTHLTFSPPAQLVDGAVVDFIDEDTKAIVASARLRYRNRMLIDRTTGDMRVELALSDIVFARARLQTTTPQ